MYQKITIIGNLGRDPEMRYTPAGQPVTTFPVATNRTYTDANGIRVKETTWFRVTLWGSQAENANNYLRGGSRVYIEGRLDPDPDTGSPKVFTRKDGTPGASFEVIGEKVVYLTSASTVTPETPEL